MVRQIRSLLYEQGYTIGGARWAAGNGAGEGIAGIRTPSPCPDRQAGADGAWVARPRHRASAAQQAPDARWYQCPGDRGVTLTAGELVHAATWSHRVKSGRGKYAILMGGGVVGFESIPSPIADPPNDGCHGRALQGASRRRHAGGCLAVIASLTAWLRRRRAVEGSSDTDIRAADDRWPRQGVDRPMMGAGGWELAAGTRLAESRPRPLCSGICRFRKQMADASNGRPIWPTTADTVQEGGSWSRRTETRGRWCLCPAGGGTAALRLCLPLGQRRLRLPAGMPRSGAGVPAADVYDAVVSGQCPRL